MSKMGSGPLSISAAARSLRCSRAELYGILRAYGIRPEREQVAEGEKRDHPGQPAKLITAAQMAEIRRRLKEVGGLG